MLPNHRRRAREQSGVKEAIEGIARQGLKRKEALQRLRELFPEGLFSDKDVANELQKYRLQGVEQEQVGGGEEMEDGGEEMDGAEGEVEAQLQVQLQNQTGLGQQDQQILQQQMGQSTQAFQQTNQLHQQPQQMQSQQQNQQHQHIFAPGVPAYW